MPSMCLVLSMVACLRTWQPSEKNIEQEGRLLYIAMTRAKHCLALVTPQCFYVRQPRRGGAVHQRDAYPPHPWEGGKAVPAGHAARGEE